MTTLVKILDVMPFLIGSATLAAGMYFDVTPWVAGSIAIFGVDWYKSFGVRRST